MRETHASKISGDVVQSQYFDVITTHAINGDVVLVQDQFTGAWYTAGPAHARVSLQFGHSVF